MVLDFSSVSNVDTTSIQTLVDIRSTVERYTSSPVEFHFANILSPWIRRGLLAGGFGTGSALHQLTEIASAFPAGNALDPQEKEAREQAEKERRERALAAGAPVSSTASEDRRQYVHDLESGLGGGREESSHAAGRDSMPPPFHEIGESITVPELDKKDGTQFGSRSGTETGSGKSSADLRRDDRQSGEGNLTAPSEVSVPVIWGADLTPFFHLDLQAAFTASLGKDPRANARTRW